MEIKISGLVAAIELQGQGARLVIEANITITKNSGREEESWGPHAAVRREVEESLGGQWMIKGRMWKRGCKQVCGQKPLGLKGSYILPLYAVLFWK